MAGILTVIWWRDIPAQVIAKDKRRASKVVLHPRFQVAIDRAALKAGGNAEAGQVFPLRDNDLAQETLGVRRRDDRGCLVRLHHLPRGDRLARVRHSRRRRRRG